MEYAELLRVLQESRARKISTVDASSATTVPAGASEIITITPPAGKIHKVLSVRYEADSPSGATSGYHCGTLYNMSFKWLGIRLTSAYDVRINYWSNDPTGTTTTRPPTAEAIILAINNVYGTNTEPIKFEYENLTDADQTSIRPLQLVYEVFDELS